MPTPFSFSEWLGDATGRPGSGADRAGSLALMHTLRVTKAATTAVTTHNPSAVHTGRRALATLALPASDPGSRHLHWSVSGPRMSLPATLAGDRLLMIGAVGHAVNALGGSGDSTRNRSLQKAKKPDATARTKGIKCTQNRTKDRAYRPKNRARAVLCCVGVHICVNISLAERRKRDYLSGGKRR